MWKVLLDLSFTLIYFILFLFFVYVSLSLSLRPHHFYLVIRSCILLQAAVMTAAATGNRQSLCLIWFEHQGIKQNWIYPPVPLVYTWGCAVCVWPVWPEQQRFTYVYSINGDDAAWPAGRYAQFMLLKFTSLIIGRLFHFYCCGIPANRRWNLCVHIFLRVFVSLAFDSSAVHTQLTVASCNMSPKQTILRFDAICHHSVVE